MTHPDRHHRHDRTRPARRSTPPSRRRGRPRGPARPRAAGAGAGAAGRRARAGRRRSPSGWSSGCGRDSRRSLDRPARWRTRRARGSLARSPGRATPSAGCRHRGACSPPSRRSMTVVVIGVAVTSVDVNRTGSDDGGGDGGRGRLGRPGARDDPRRTSQAGAAVSQAPARRRTRPPAAAPSPRSRSPSRTRRSPPSAGEPHRPPGAAASRPAARDRKIERSISMTLEAPDEEIPDVAQGVTEVTNRHGGFVLRSNLNSDEQGATASSSCASRPAACARRWPTWPGWRRCARRASRART